ncbi:MAG: hypothetical protein GY875_23575 [Gammaproteobacteria bacterium]|nr:hypothetical protein [Gammaproteobacteria bacterium]
MLTVISVGGGTVLCFWLIYHAHKVDSPVWILEQVVCPIIRIVVLLIVVAQVYPVIDVNSNSVEFWKMLGQEGLFNDLLNILFFAGLLLSFIPLVNHPVFALPIQSMLTIALVFNWQYTDAVFAPQLLPSPATALKIFGWMLLAYYVTRESSIYLSRWIDRRLALDGSIRLVSDAIYLVLQIPVMLIYCNFLKQQLP